ncbi:MAG TPA: hypothetical protein VLA23_06830, partial [Candidatus Limnocylindrales bacterium]|nr:hypothetical protein [Candidatus Limnocylindrales bacterium]
MNERTDLERTLAAWLSAEAPRGVPGDLLGGVFATTRASGPWPTWRALLSVAPMRTQSRVLAGSPGWRTAGTLLALALIATLLAAAGVLVAGSGLLRPPPERSSVDPCTFLSAAGVRAARGVIAGDVVEQPLPGPMYWRSPESPLFRAPGVEHDYLGCGYPSSTYWDGPMWASVWVRTAPMSGVSEVDLVRGLFGGRATVERIAGTRVWRNDCELVDPRSGATGCPPAFALSV